LFFPWGMSSSIRPGMIGFAFILFLVKILVLSLWVAILESTIAKYRFFRLPDLLFTSFILSIIAIGLGM